MIDAQQPEHADGLVVELRDADHPPLSARPLGSFPHHPGQGHKRAVPPWEPEPGLAERLERLREMGE